MSAANLPDPYGMSRTELPKCHVPGPQIVMELSSRLNHRKRRRKGTEEFDLMLMRLSVSLGYAVKGRQRNTLKTVTDSQSQGGCQQLGLCWKQDVDKTSKRPTRL
jgi:hypothetical protein